MKIALVFSGQGAQYTGMGKEICERYPVSNQIFEKAGEEIKGWCFEGDKETLRRSEVTQPSIYTVTMANYYAFMEEFSKLIAGQNFGEKSENIEISALAGFSLGEYAALTVAGVIKDFKTGLEIVKKRGKWMGEGGTGGMVAAMGSRSDILEIVETVKGNSVLEGVNFNTPTQTVVAGDRDALERFCEEAKKHSHLKTVMLSVGNAFHSSLMEPVSEKLYDLLKDEELRAPSIPVFSNATSKDISEYLDSCEKAGFTTSDALARLMALQAKSPVYWEEIVSNLVDAGIDVFIEIGPGKTLSGLVKKCNHEVLSLHVDNLESLDHTITALKEKSMKMGEQ